MAPVLASIDKKVDTDIEFNRLSQQQLNSNKTSYFAQQEINANADDARWMKVFDQEFSS